jgi:hypothetical protein
MAEIDLPSWLEKRLRGTFRERNVHAAAARAVRVLVHFRGRHYSGGFNVPATLR